MKKLIFAFILGLGLTACGSSEANTEVADTTEVTVDSVMNTDSLVIDTVAIDSVM